MKAEMLAPLSPIFCVCPVRIVLEVMIGLEKIKVKAELSSSARALPLDDMHHLYDHCSDDNHWEQSGGEPFDMLA